MKRAWCIAGAALLGACGTFEDPTIVIDTRIVAGVAEPPEQVVPIDLSGPPPTDPAELGLVDTEVCFLVADPAASRGLGWRARACAPTDSGRCDEAGRPVIDLGSGSLEDPEEATAPPRACATLPADPALLLVLEDAIRNSDLGGFGGIDVQVDVEVTAAAAGDAPAADVFGEKRVRFAPLLPADRVANHNPTVERFDILVEGRDPVPLPLGRCADQSDPIQVAPGADLPLIPVEPEGVREEYVLPTLDGGSRRFTENLRYQWLASTGEWKRAETGGPRDASGMFPPLDSRWTAPDDVTEPTDVELWIIQRDERLGAAWFQSCVRIAP